MLTKTYIAKVLAIFLLALFVVAKPSETLAFDGCSDFCTPGSDCTINGGHECSSCNFVTCSTPTDVWCCGLGGAPATPTPIPITAVPTLPARPDPPFPAPYIDCLNTASPEFHSLRPYQTSPCNKILEELDLYCANDLITKEEITVGPSDAIPNTCTTQADGSITGCKFSIDRTVGIEIDLTNAELPIVGNTQLVPNQVNDGNPRPVNFSWEQRVNEYLSWWLQGASYKAEEELIDPAIKSDLHLLEEKIRENVTFAGPIRKLYPKFIRQHLQREQIKAAGRGLDKHARHNQIYICTQGGSQVPCQYDFALGQYMYNNASVSAERLKSGNPTNTPTFSFLNFTSTEDRLGVIFADALLFDPILGLDIQPGPGEGNEVVISAISFVPTVDTDLLYFAHMIESNELSDQLQSTYVPEILDGKKFATSIGEGMDVYNTYRCDLKDVRWNPGDDLFGELGTTSIQPITVPETGQQVTGESIAGDVEYTADFTCDYFPPLRDVPCYDRCLNISSDPGYQQCTNLIPPVPTPPYPDRTACCDGICSNLQECKKTALTATSVYTRTPVVQELWERTVDGPVSLMKRILPKIGQFGMFEEWKDYPAVTSANYRSTTGATILAGDPNANRSGSNAELFIPHLGGIKVFAMTMVQDTLKPKLLGSKYLASGLPPGSGGLGTCAPIDGPLNSNLCDKDNLWCSGSGTPLPPPRMLLNPNWGYKRKHDLQRRKWRFTYCTQQWLLKWSHLRLQRRTFPN